MVVRLPRSRPLVALHRHPPPPVGGRTQNRRQERHAGGARDALHAGGGRRHDRRARLHPGLQRGAIHPARLLVQRAHRVQASENLWGFKLSDVVGRNVKMLMPNPERDRHDGYLKRYLETGKQRVFGMGRDVTGVHKDGTILPVRLSVSEKKDGDKRIWTAIVQKLN